MKNVQQDRDDPAGTPVTNPSLTMTFSRSSTSLTLTWGISNMSGIKTLLRTRAPLECEYLATPQSLARASSSDTGYTSNIDLTTGPSSSSQPQLDTNANPFLIQTPSPSMTVQPAPASSVHPLKAPSPRHFKAAGKFYSEMTSSSLPSIRQASSRSLATITPNTPKRSDYTTDIVPETPSLRLPIVPDESPDLSVPSGSSQSQEVEMDFLVNRKHNALIPDATNELDDLTQVPKRTDECSKLVDEVLPGAQPRSGGKTHEKAVWLSLERLCQKTGHLSERGKGGWDHKNELRRVSTMRAKFKSDKRPLSSPHLILSSEKTALLPSLGVKKWRLIFTFAEEAHLWQLMLLRATNYPILHKYQLRKANEIVPCSQSQDFDGIFLEAVSPRRKRVLRELEQARQVATATDLSLDKAVKSPMLSQNIIPYTAQDAIFQSPNIERPDSNRAINDEDIQSLFETAPVTESDSRDEQWMLQGLDRDAHRPGLTSKVSRDPARPLTQPKVQSWQTDVSPYSYPRDVLDFLDM
ncbi:MAG: hypothetical protein NXY57DRAFT_977379 [Lentinula lateritia]|nr:MAG: hypothetical protein NXY57DRAFT_977379 [Lentinula lateritia]